VAAIQTVVNVVSGTWKKIHSKEVIYFYTHLPFPFDVTEHDRHFIMTTSALPTMPLQALHVIYPLAFQ